MKTVKLKSIALNNFRGHKSTVVSFGDFTTITGGNGSGKSTIFDAFVWLLFGKDQFDRKDFEIIPTVNNEMLKKVDPEVRAIIDFDGREIEISRILHQKWVRKRGTAEEVYDGNETLYQWDGVDIKASDYKARVDLMVEETVFKLITKPDAFLNMHWTKQREFLFQMAGTLPDSEILERMANLSNKDVVFNLTNILNQGKKLADFKKELSALKKKAKDELEDIQPRIDQTVRLMPESRDFSSIEAMIKSIDNEISFIDEKISDRSKAIRSQYEEIQAKHREINELEIKQQKAINDKRTKNQQDAFTANQQRTALQNELDTINEELKTAKRLSEDIGRELTSLEKKKEDRHNELVSLREMWKQENALEYKPQDGCLVCPVFGSSCGDPSAIGKHEQSKEAAKKAFFEMKEKRLDKLEEEGLGMSEEINRLNESIIEKGEQHFGLMAKVEKLSAKHDNLLKTIQEIEIATPAHVVAEELPEWQSLQSEIDSIKSTIQEVKPIETGDLNTAKAELNAKRDALKKELSDKEVIVRCQTEIESLKKRGDDLAQQIANIEGQEFSIETFNRIRISECEKRINSMFSHVKFKLFDYTNEGNEFEACIATNMSGVSYSVTNTADQVNIGLDIIRTLSNFYNVQAPIFIDRAESVNETINTGSQMIVIKVTEKGTPFQVK